MTQLTFVDRGPLTFRVHVGGPADGVPALLLHGFPQDASAWDEVVPGLHRVGLRTLAPDQRGYSPAAAPREVSAYRMPELVADALAVLDAHGHHQAHVVGHDWGGAVAWALAAWHPDRVSSLTVLSTPHPAALGQALRDRDADQARRSWYVGAFQVPSLPELALARMLRRGSLRGSGLPADAMQRYADRLGSARRLRGPVNWYRAARSGGPRIGDVVVPTSYLWGRRDPFLGPVAARATREHVQGDYRFVELDAGHWLPERRALEVSGEILARALGI